MVVSKNTKGTAIVDLSINARVLQEQKHFFCFISAWQTLPASSKNYGYREAVESHGVAGEREHETTIEPFIPRVHLDTYVCMHQQGELRIV